MMRLGSAVTKVLPLVHLSQGGHSPWDWAPNPFPDNEFWHFYDGHHSTQDGHSQHGVEQGLVLNDDFDGDAGEDGLEYPLSDDDEQEYSRRRGGLKMAMFAVRGLTAITKSIKPFMEDPPRVEEGLASLNGELWKVMESVELDASYGPEDVEDLRRLWDGAFERLPGVVDEISRFQKEGDTDALTSAITSIIDVAWDSCADKYPSFARYLDATRELVGGLGTSWDLFAAGEPIQAVEAVWVAVKSSTQGIAPAAAESSRIFKAILGEVDGVVSRLNRHVLDYKKRIANSEVCWKKTMRRARTRPNQCREGFVWDQGHLCVPTVEHGANCWQNCNKTAGMCDAYCGQGKACCRPGFWQDPAECQGATGYKNYAFTKGSAQDYHQCVAPGPALKFEVSGCSESRANGWWVQGGNHSGRPRYTKAGDPDVIMEWSQSRGVWRLFIDKKSLGLKRLLGATRVRGGRTTLYHSTADQSTLPVFGWEPVHGTGDTPSVQHPPPGASSLAEAATGTLDGSLARKGDAGTTEATCDVDSMYSEKSAKWCLAGCPSGYIERGHMCEQLCGGDFPEDGPKMCGTDYGKIMVAVAETALTAIHGAVKVYDVLKQLREGAPQWETLSETVNTFIDLGKPLARLACKTESYNHTSILG
mmetsp:Transcript_111784/g.316483  ORF Transcript_111784/g.316483 Transcript_111784/m.316483 type:complete len:645 (-) Transcript_111784:9-1943(-)